MKILSEEELKDIFKNQLMTTKEVCDYLDITKQRLTQLIDKEILSPVSRGYYRRVSVEKRKQEQEALRKQYGVGVKNNEQ